MSDVTDYEWDPLPMQRLERTYEEYMDGLYDTLYDEPEQDQDTETGIHFCGCDTCVIRETFAFLMPRFLDLYNSGAIRSVDTQHATQDGGSDAVQLVLYGGEE